MEITDFKHETRLRDALSDMEEITLSDLRELLKISEQITDPESVSEAGIMCDVPVQVGNLLMYKPTIGSLRIMEEIVANWDLDEIDELILTAYCLVNARSPEKLLFTDRTTMLETLDEFSKTIDITFEELFKAVNACVSGFPKVVKSDEVKASSYSRFVRELLKTYGGTINQWVWDTSADSVIWLVREETKQGRKAEAVQRFKNKMKAISEQ